ncbi:MAG: hypothetical protein KGJ03_06405 [Betaproteobacteria bacterium]|nr:hypothetical protein [Betaproteobacteria bacterium]MDE2153008.1 hypothetical protein [Betaproteobacteria bacterium]
MLTKAEKRILHGVYLRRPRIDEWYVYRSLELAWLIDHDYASAKEWGSDGKITERILDPNADMFGPASATHQELTAILTHLRGAGLIEWHEQPVVSLSHEVRVTYEGAQIARKLRTWQGQFGVWYSEHKDGVIGLLITAAVSAVTSLIVAYLTHRK